MRKLVLVLVISALATATIWGDSWLRGKILISARRFSNATGVFWSNSASSPESSYARFRQALARDGASEAIKYFSPGSRSVYAKLLGNTKKQSLIMSWPEKLTLKYEVNCQPDEECQKLAVYNLSYYLAETKVVLPGESTILPAGIYDRELVFVQDKAGKWLIKKI